MMQLSTITRRPCALVPHLTLQQPPLLRRVAVCRWAPDSKDEAGSSTAGSRPAEAAGIPTAGCPPPTTEAAGTSSTSDAMTSRRLINSLLDIRSLQSASLSSADLSPAEEAELSANMLGADATQRGPSEPATLFDDPAAEDFDPLVLDLLGFSSVAQYLDTKLGAAASEAKAALAAVTVWALVACAVMTPLGGTDTYTDSINILTDGGLQMGNLVFLWAALLAYYSFKSGVMAVVTSIRSWRLHEAQGETLEELANTVQAQDQRRAFWRLQDKLQNADERAKRTYAEFALSSVLLAVLLLMGGGADHLELQLETVDEEAYLNLLVMLWLFWESYFVVVGAVVKVSNWASAGIAKLQYTRKWGSSAGTRSKQ